MKKLIALCFISICTFPAYAQDSSSVEGLLSRTVVKCEDVQYNAIELIPGMHGKHQHDSLAKLMQYWESKCNGLSEQHFTFKLLYAIGQRNFTEAIYEDRDMIEYMETYKSNLTYARKGVFTNNDHYLRYYNYLQGMAVSMLSTPGLSRVEVFLVNYYANPTLTDNKVLINNEFAGSALQRQYNDGESKKRDMGGIYIAAIAGAWVPTGKLSFIGVHPYVGYELGGRGKRLQVGLAMYFSFINSPNTYYVMKDSILYPTRYFLGGYIGVNSSYDIVQTKKSMFCLLAGVGYDGFDVLSIGKGVNNETESVGALNINAGLGYRFRVGKTSYLGLEVKYNNVNYVNRGGTDLSGDAFTIGLSYGGSYKPNKNRY